jgi:hypothetical protein
MKGCTFCYKSEKGSPEIHGEFVCSRCVQKLLLMPQDKLIEAYHLAMEKGNTQKAHWFKSCIEEEEFYEQETGKARSNLVRERPLRTAQSARD